jgi:hypothetical protein
LEEQLNGSEADGSDDLRKALNATDRRLQRMTRMLADRADPKSEEVKAQIKGTQRQVKRNTRLLGKRGERPSAQRAPAQGPGDRSEQTTRAVVRAKRRVE